MIKNLTPRVKRIRKVNIMTANNDASRAARLRAQKKYDEAHRGNYKNFYIKCNVNTDADIIEYLQGVDNVNGYVKELIRKDIASGK